MKQQTYLVVFSSRRVNNLCNLQSGKQCSSRNLVLGLFSDFRTGQIFICFKFNITFNNYSIIS